MACEAQSKKDLANYALYERMAFHRTSTAPAAGKRWVPGRPGEGQTPSNERLLPPDVGLDDTAPAVGNEDYFWIAMNKGGVGFIGAPEVTDLETEHQSAGVKYSSTDRRNGEEQTLTFNLWQQHGQLVFNAGMNVMCSGIPPYFVVDQFWVDANGNIAIDDSKYEQGVTAAHVGRRLQGCVANTFGFTIDRQAGGVMEISLGAYVNADKPIEVLDLTAVPASYYDIPTRVNPWPDNNPNSNTATLVDLLVADADNVLPTGVARWDRGDNEQIRQLGFTYTHNTAPDVFRASADQYLNQSWTKMNRGTPSLELTSTIVINDAQMMDWHRGADRRKVMSRIAGIGTLPNRSEQVAAGAIAAGDDSHNVAIGDSSEFTCGDVVLVTVPENPTGKGQRFDVMVVRSIGAVAAGTLDLVNLDDWYGFTELQFYGDGATGEAAKSTWRISVDASETYSISNTGWMVEMPFGEVTTPSVPEVADLVYVINPTIGARLLAGQTDLINFVAQDDGYPVIETSDGLVPSDSDWVAPTP